MKRLTVWEAICRQAGKDGTDAVSLDEVLQLSGAGEQVVNVELRQFAEGGLISMDGSHLRLTESGRNSCSELHDTEAFAGDL